MKVNKKVLENGFSVISSVDNSNPLISLQLYVKMGSTREKPSEAGFSHFTEHLVFKSTQKFPENKIMEQVSFLGGNINAYTEFDTTCFYLTLPSEYLDEGIDILTQIVRYANFSDEEFESERKVVIEEFKQYQDDPEDFFIEEIAKFYFKKNNYRNPIIGNLERLQSCKPDELRSFYKKYYSPSNAFLIVTGDINEKELDKILEKYFAFWEQKKIDKLPLMKEDFPNMPEFHTWHKDISRDMLAFVLPDLAETDTDANALALAAKNFGIGKNSRLFHRLFQIEKIIDTIKVHSLSGLNSGITIFLVMPKKNADLKRITEIFIQELNLLYHYGLSELEVKEKKRELIHYYRYSYEYVETIATGLGNEEVLSDYTRFLRYEETINKIDKKSVDRAIRRYYKPCSLFIYHLGKENTDKKTFMDLLKKCERKSDRIETKLDFYKTTLPNGMNIIFKRIKGKPTIGISLSFRVSQLNETSKNLGINVSTSSLLLYGNENSSYKQLMNFCTSNGINLGISPGLETTNLRMKCFTDMLPSSLEIISDILQKPLFPKQHFENLRNTFISGMDRISDFPQYYANHLWRQMFFGKKSNMVSREGMKSTLRALSRKQLINWYHQHYVPSNMHLAIVGDFDFTQIEAICEQLFSNMENKDYKSEQKIILTPSEKKIQHLRKGLNQANINLGGWAGNITKQADNTAFHVLANIIGGDSNSLLFEELREKRGLSYASHFSYTSLMEKSYFELSTLVDKDREDEAMDVIMTILEKVKKKKFSAKELQRTKNYIRGQRLMDEESALSQAQNISILESIGLGYKFYLERDKRLENVTLDQLQKLAEKYFNEDNYYIHIMN